MLFAIDHGNSAIKTPDFVFHHKGTGILLDDLGLGNHGGIGLGIDQHLANHQADGGIINP